MKISLKILSKFCFLILTTYTLSAQENNKGDILIDLSIGLNFANFINSEAPHKLFLPGSEDTPLICQTEEVESTITYDNYETSLIKDVLITGKTGINIEYFIGNNLSIQAGVNYETKGINLKYIGEREGYVIMETYPLSYFFGFIREEIHIKVANNYLSMPILINKYVFEKKNFYIGAGVYGAYLIKSKVNIFKEKSGTSENGFFDYKVSIDLPEDKEKQYTEKYDYGIIISSGFCRKLTEKLFLDSNINLNYGLKKPDAKYNNEFEVTPLGVGTVFGRAFVTSTNYFGLNSHSKNINLSLSFGLTYKFGK